MSKMRILALVLGIMMFTVLLSGCGETEPADATKSSTEENKEEKSSQDSIEEKQEAETVPLKVYTWAPQKQQDEEKVLDAVSEYLKEKMNADVEIIMMELSDYQTKVPLLISSGETIDLCFASGWNNPFLEGVKTDAFLPMNDLLESHGQELLDFLPESLWKGTKINGETYGIPMYKEMGRQYGFYINKALADKYGFDLSTVKSFADLEPMLKVIKENEPDVVGIADLYSALHASMISNVTGYHGGVGAINAFNDEPVIDGANDTVVNQYATPEFRETFDLVRRWYEAGYCPEDPTNFANNGEDMNMAKEGKLFARWIWYAPGSEKGYSASAGHEFVYVPLHRPVIESDVAVGNVWAIPYTSAQPEKAMELLELLYTDKKLGTMLRHGIEGTHYVMNDDGTISPAEGIDITNRPYDLGMGWWLGTIFNQHVDNSQTSADVFEDYYDFNSTAKASETMGYVFDTSNVLNELAALDAVNQQYFNILANGMVDVDEYLPQFLDALNDAGAEKVMAEAQKQYDAFKAQQ